MDKLKEFKEKNFKELDAFMPIVKKVHGPNHKEIFDVADVYEDIKAKIDSDDDNLDKEFTDLKKITDNYKIPGDVCETYEHIYKQLEKLNKTYDNR